MYLVLGLLAYIYQMHRDNSTLCLSKSNAEQRLLPFLPYPSCLTRNNRRRKREEAMTGQKSGAIPAATADSRVQFGIQLGTVSRPPSLLHSKRSSRNELAQKPPSENCHPGREGALRTLASGYVAHLQSLVETVSSRVPPMSPHQ